MNMQSNSMLFMWLSSMALFVFIAGTVVVLAKPDCTDSADFFYEIVLALSFYPIANCSKKQEKEISTFLQHQMNRILKNNPGTINTQNKICKHTINNRRLLSASQPFTMMEHMWNSWFSSDDGLNDRDHRMLTHSFFYIGGGRCRFCFLDDRDARRLLLLQKTSKRNLLNFAVDHDNQNDDSPKVTDIALCPNSMQETVYSTATDDDNFPTDYLGYKGWTNQRVKHIEGIEYSILGPYKAGESFGRVFTVEKKQQKGGNKKMRPVSSANLSFSLWAFDIPNEYTHEILADEPFYLFINGIKLDFNILFKVPGVRVNIFEGEREVDAHTFAGIRSFFWEDMKVKNKVLGPQVDREYIFQVSVPPILFEHGESKLRVEFLIKPQAKAKFYGINKVGLSVVIEECEIIGMEKSPFDEFKLVMESKLNDQLGMDLTRKFQNKVGHCLENRVPIVGVHLVQKDKWATANPRCDDK